MQKRRIIKPILACLTLIVNSLFSQVSYDERPLYQEGKLYLKLNLNNNIDIRNKDTILNDSSGLLNSLFSKYQVSKTEKPFLSLNSPGLNKTYRITFDLSSKIDSFIIDLTQINSIIEYAERIPAVYSFSVPNDPVYTNSPTILYHLPLLNANQASNIHISNGNAIVAIVDDAVLKVHEDLWENIGSINTGTDVADGDSDPNPPFVGTYATDGNIFSHGTHVAGIAGARTDNTVGISSIGWNNKIMCVKTCSDNSNPSTGLTNPYDGLAWAAANGAQVINMSWGSYAYSLTDYSVVVAAKNSNVVLVAAAGNNAINFPAFPAAYGEGLTGQTWEIYDKKLVVAVSSLDQNNNASVWGGGLGTNYGTWIDIAAYGSNIYSTLASSSSGSAIINIYGFNSGTSMASPMIAGIVGLMRSYNMSKSPDEIIDCLINTANPDIYDGTHPLNQYMTLGAGRADASAALRCISTTCSVNPIVIITPSSASLCANTTLTLTANQGATTFSWNTGATSNSIVVSSYGIYSVIANYSGSCSATASINFTGPPTLTLSLSTNTSLCSGTTMTVISATGNFSALVWQPGGMTTNSVIMNPSSNTVYSVTANPLCGGTTATINVIATGNPIPPQGEYSILGTSLTGNFQGVNTLWPNGRFFLSTDATVNTAASLYNSLFYMSPSIKITVPSNSTLNINSSILKTCSNNMWKGIVLDDESHINVVNSSIIEDAYAAISSTHVPQNSVGIEPATIYAHHSIFNRNYIDISLNEYYDNFSGTLAYDNYLRISGCVFSCRIYGATQPSGGFGDPFTGSYAYGVRLVLTPTTGLAPPYLTSISSTVNLKSPYSNQVSHIAICLNSVGITPGPAATTNGTASMPGITIGDASHYKLFNLFDTHGSFIVANKSNVTIINNVFQNTQTYTVSGGSTFGGAAIDHNSTYTSTDVMHTMLNMSSTAASTGNRFWNCHTGIDIDKTYLFWLENALFRSTQSSTNTPGYYPGNTGIHASTNNFDYYIANNEFTNIEQAINIPISSGLVAPKPSWNSPPVVGIFAHRIRISNNTFSTGTVTNTYLKNAVNMTCPNPVPWQYFGPFIVPNVSVTPYTQAFSVKNNTISEAFNGISIVGSHGFQVDISENLIKLKDNNTVQKAIELSNCLPTTSTSIGKNIVSQNTASFTSSPSSSTSTQSSLIFCGDNGMGISSPSVCCNNLSQGYNGFVFDGVNNNAAWGGNSMTTPMNQAFVLSHTAAIGTQGGTNTAIANRWVGGSSSWNGSNYGTYVTSGSQALNSKLYVSAIPSYSPDNNGGGISPNNFVFNTSFYANTSGGTYVCGDFPNHKVIKPLETDFESDVPHFRAKNALYRFVLYNDSVRNSDTAIANFFSNQEGTSIEKFMQIEEKLYLKQGAEAESLVGEIDDSEFNLIENNYMTYFNIYLSYLDLNEGENLNSTDSSSLKTLAELCPGENGPVIYQALALYNTLYRKILIPNCSEEGARPQGPSTQNQKLAQLKQLAIYPNPARDYIIVTSTQESDLLDVSIIDLLGKVMLSQHSKTNNFISKLELDLINGAYSIKVVNSKGESVTTKLIISK